MPYQLTSSVRFKGSKVFGHVKHDEETTLVACNDRCTPMTTLMGLIAWAEQAAS